MGSPLPLVPPWYHAGAPLLVIIKLKKVKFQHVPFTYIHPTNTQTDTQMHKHVYQ